MKKIYLSLLICLAAILFSSCLIVIPDSSSSTEPAKGTVKIDNYDSNSYISKVYYQKGYYSDSKEWIECWSIEDANTDKNLKITLDKGYYTFRLYTIFPKYKHGIDYYDYYRSETVYVSSGITYLTYDGSVFYAD